ncbi:hypothetical protein V1520DRAFT_371927 [Lipomyces starkeyi]|uniref:Uncharacterized protein n=1 Tax=Lipomyces starkeyi NRRL Y-11557 TaxID=675824 RepID=A0A1E3PYF4_LIPST|nr:hypothetical protein LIPSTDRAFT_5776 [Lipomyces starkeyi NRRL Y-11557]
MDSRLAKFREFYRQPRTCRQDRILILTDCPQELYQTIISEISEKYPFIEVVYSSSQQTLFVSTIRCEIGQELGRYVGDQLGGWLNYYIGFDSGTLFTYTSMLDPFVVRSCVVPPNDLTYLRYPKAGRTTDHVGRVIFESGYLSNYKQLMTKIKLHVNNDDRNLSLTVFLILVDESPKFEIPEINLAEELSNEVHMQRFLDTLLSYRSGFSGYFTRDIIQNIEYEGQRWFGELTSCIIHVYRYYPELKALALLHCIDCLEWLRTAERRVKLNVDLDLHINDVMIPQHTRGRSFRKPWVPLSLNGDILVEEINSAIGETAMNRFEEVLTTQHRAGEGEG